MNQYGDNPNISKDQATLLWISPQGWAVIGILAFMVFLQRVNPFMKFTTNLLKAQRYLYLSLFFLFLVLSGLLYFYDPFGFMNEYWKIVTPILIFFGIFLFAIILWYSVEFSDSDVYQSREELKPTPIVSFFTKLALVAGVFGMVVALTIWIVVSANKMTGTPGYIASIIVNILLVIAILGFVWNVLSKSTILRSSPYTRLIVNSILYIPCIFVNILDVLVKAYYNEKQETKRSDIVGTLLILIIFTLYFIVPYGIAWIYRKLQGGKLLLNEPIGLNIKTPLSGYLKLNDIPRDAEYVPYNYNYALSLWTYIYGTGNVNSSYSEYTPIMDYGGKPTILYKADTNSIMIKVKLGNDPPKNLADNLEQDDEGNVIIYTSNDIKLQKWNNFIINYQEGIMDIFFNGDLVKSVGNLVPYMEFDLLSVGNSQGVNGEVCNVMYYKNALDIDQIKYLYSSVKNNNPPVIPFSDTNTSLLK